MIHTLAGLLASRLSTDLAGVTADGEEGYETAAADLLEPDALFGAIARMPERSRSDHNPMISGTLFAKSYTLVALSALSAFSLSDVRLSVRLDEIRLRIRPEDGMRVLMRGADGGALGAARDRVADAASDAPAHRGESRSDEFRARFRQLIEHNCEVIFTQIHRATGAEMRTMWALLSANVRNTYLRIVQQAESLGIDEDRLALIEHDRDTIFVDESLEARNPLRLPTRLYVPGVPGADPTYLRNRCCLRYRIEVGGEGVPYCLTCPLIADQERERMIADHLRHEQD